MQLQISVQGVPLEGTVKNLIEKRLRDDLERILKHFPDDIKKASVTVQKQSRHGYKASFSMQLPGFSLYSEEKNDDFPTLLVILRDEVKRQIRKHKEKITEK